MDSIEAYENYGYYVLDDQGNPTEGKIIWADVDNIGQTFSMDGLDLSISFS